MFALLTLTSMLAQASPSPSAVPATQIAPGTYAYKVSLAGASTGQSTITVKRNGAATEIDEDTSGTVGQTSGTAKAILNLGPDLAPTSYQNAYAAGGYSGKISATFTAAQATVDGGMSGPKTFTLGGAKHFVVLDGAELSGFIALPAQMQSWANAPALAVFPLYGQSISLAPKAADASTRPGTVAATDAGVTVDSGPAPFTIWYDPTTLVMDELDVPSQHFVVTRAKS